MSSSRCVAAVDAAASARAPETTSSAPPSAPPMPRRYQAGEFVVDLELGHRHPAASTALPTSSGVHEEGGFTDGKLGLGQKLERRTSTVEQQPPPPKRPSDNLADSGGNGDCLAIRSRCEAIVAMSSSSSSWG
ncbi:unnamed protein product [Miscanthus lutarioriparius]|uniref:Uncharacterized protein n=1 Tax=Miscanthus lutarioriparius TaxID=422564 RepID=A0A811Q8C5_9POAL|nr:unnamed protein product [Miscanthus lutarioriparius]